MRKAGAVLGAFVLVAMVGTVARGDLYGKFKGQIITAQQEIPVSDDEDELAATLARVAKTVLDKRGDTWSFNMMGFLTAKPKTDEVMLLIYDITDGKRTYMTGKDISIDPEALIMAAAIEVTEDDGIKSGKKIELVLGRLVNGKETVFAKTKVTFK
jgi:hypothetical protein